MKKEVKDQKNPRKKLRLNLPRKKMCFKKTLKVTVCTSMKCIYHVWNTSWLGFIPVIFRRQK